MPLFNSAAHQKEFKNYFRFLLKTFGFWEFGKKSLTFLWARIFARRIPKEYQNLAAVRIDIPDGQVSSVNPVFDISGDQPYQSSSGSKLKIRLATRHVHMADLDSWKCSFEDVEDIFAAHRFGWILPILSTGYSNEHLMEIDDLIRDWIRHHPYEEGRNGWDSYSVSERLINWIYFLSFVSYSGYKTDEQEIIDSLVLHIEALGGHLEFRSSGTNNHLLNNGRALYIGGRFLGLGNVTDLGKKIIRRTVKTMFTDDGFLREGSSHYQILMARTFLEICMAARNTEDIQFYRDIEPLVEKILSAAAFFLTDRPFPLFGDSSPDFSTDFHLGVVSVAKRRLGFPAAGMQYPDTGWANLFNKKKIDSGHNNAIQEMKGNSKGETIRLAEYPSSGYYRAEVGEFVLWLYVNPLGYVPEWSHGHADIGSFILYWRHSPVIVDNGRFDFRPLPASSYGRSGRSHNGVSIDGFEPCVTHSFNGFAQLMTNKYMSFLPKVKVESANAEVTIRVEINGFKRIASDLKVYRTLTLGKNGLEIDDRIIGSGTRQVETFFHFFPGVSVNVHSDAKAVLQTQNLNELLLHSVNENSHLISHQAKSGIQSAGWHFPEYGRKRKAWTVIYTQNELLPLRNHYRIEGR